MSIRKDSRINASPVASFPASTHCSLGSRGGPEQRTRVVPSDKCAASWGSEDAEMRMITARCVRVLLRYTDSLCRHSMFTLQQVMPLSKTCNRLLDMEHRRRLPGQCRQRQREQFCNPQASGEAHMHHRPVPQTGTRLDIRRIEDGLHLGDGQMVDQRLIGFLRRNG